MSRHWTIGEFSARSGLTARALRLYDEQGVLKPVGVDSTTGYRWYAEAQLPLARLIAALRRAGLPLALVREVSAADAGRAHEIVDHWWAAVQAEHAVVARLIPELHHLIEGELVSMTAESDSERPAELRNMLDAIHRGDPVAVQTALQDTPHLTHLRTESGSTMLGEAARALTDDHAPRPRDAGADHLGVVRLVLDAGADPSLGDRRGWTPLHTAGMSGHAPLARILIGAGAGVDAVVDGVPGATPLAYCLFYGHRDAASVLASTAAGPVPDDLRTASGLGDLDRMRARLDASDGLAARAAAGMDFAGPEFFPPRAAPVDDQTVLDESLSWAARSGHVDAMGLLVAHGADVNANPFRGTPLLWAIFSDSVRAATWLLEHGADPDLRHDFGGAEHGKAATAMHLAAQYGALGCLRLLLARGADASITDAAYNSTPLGWARVGEQDAAVAILEAHGA